MAANFPMIAVVSRRVTETVELVVNASSEQEAIAKTAETLSSFPKPHTVEGVPYCRVIDQIVNEAEVLDVQLYHGDNDG